MFCFCETTRTDFIFLTDERFSSVFCNFVFCGDAVPRYASLFVCVFMRVHIFDSCLAPLLGNGRLAEKPNNLNYNYNDHNNNTDQFLPEDLCSHMVISATSAQSPEELDAAWYPVNRLRNVAVRAVRTSHFLMTDIDIWPDVNAYQALHVRYKAEKERREYTTTAKTAR